MVIINVLFVQHYQYNYLYSISYSHYVRNVGEKFLKVRFLTSLTSSFSKSVSYTSLGLHG